MAKLYGRKPENWSDAELEAELVKRYAPTRIPPCRVCGGALSMQRCGGGQPTVWACSGWQPDPSDPDGRIRSPGRSAADEHYRKSVFEDTRQGGDSAVLELIRRWKG